MRIATAATALSAAMVLSGCTAASSDVSTGAPSADGSSVPRSAASADQRTRATEAVRPPRAGACYRLRYSELTDAANDSEAVPCRGRHNAQTIFVGDLDAVVDGRAARIGSSQVQDQMARRCHKSLASYVGGTQEVLALSRFKAIWFTPTATEADAGATWFRCDLVAVAAAESLLNLPRPRKLRDVLDRDSALETYGLCGTSAPGEDGFERVICSRAHSWRAVAITRLKGSAEYPGQAAVRRSGDERCRDVVSQLTGSVDRFQYGWEWPTREQWSRGQHYGFCWAEST